MTSTITTPPAVAAAVPADEAAASAGTRRLLVRLGGGALVAGPLLFLGGAVTSPSQETDDAAGYVASLARDPLLTEMSALLFHYGNLLLGVGALLLPLLVRGRRGRLATLTGTLLMVLGFLNVSGAVLSDWWIMEVGRTLPPEQAVALSERVLDAPWLQAWSGVQDLALLGVVVALAGLARAGVLSWWIVPVPLVCLAGAFVIPLSMPLVVSAVVGLAFAPLAVLGVRAFRRAALIG
ncbi:hypothetical protein [Spirilliplanes yamanashiensis]|uniref:DUF4386 family protein n=1 Tax=Spirilliplanes yamanashiensis TaxID=42233 RepID=A0A8J3YAT0_9ACTN|nr:hypothetical protein [Spirilliplanes yamanashiensis]MDP9817682.1 hypothetical protein [Spirilliplanes yamanashiensis]GIJ04492.1 hypothetical protein Sya03_38440 [Spirilliplanes yamanashiensis]